MFDSFFSNSIPMAQLTGLSGYALFGLLIAAVLLGLFLAHLISNSLTLNDYRNRMAWVFVPVLIALLMISTRSPKFGVDLRGGINMVGSINRELAEENKNNPDYVPPKSEDIIPTLIQRINPSGTKEIQIRPLGEDQIEVTIPSVSLEEAEATWERIVKTGKLEFRICARREFSEHRGLIDAAVAASNSPDFRTRTSKYVTDGKENRIGVWVGFAKVQPPASELEKGNLPKVIPYKYAPQGGHILRDKATGKIVPLTVRYGNIPDFYGLDFAVWCRDQGINNPQILMQYPKENQDVQGKHLYSVRSQSDRLGRPAIGFTTTVEGRSRLGLLTKLNTVPEGEQKKELGIVIDDRLHSAPTINSTIRGDGEISGSFTQREVNELRQNLASGKLDVSLNKNPISTDFIESTLGQELKEKGVWAIGVSLILVLVFMMVYYGFAGIVATISLILNLLLILALVMLIDQPLTLTGLAGLVLTVGMSVDANVLIFERIREELDRGAALRMAIRNGFDKATTTIVDANLTTLITALILYVFGTEQVKGFSVTLILGILMSMYTAIFCSRLMFDVAERKRWLTKLNMRRLMDQISVDFISKISVTSIASAALIVIGIISMFILGPKILDHDLRGGSTIRMVFNEKQEKSDVQAKLDELDIEVNGEKIEFSVAEFGGGETEADKVGRVFKVDSNLPAWDNRPDVERWEQLDELMTRVFADKLEMHRATVSKEPQSGSGSDSDAGSQQQSSLKRLPLRSETPQTPGWNAVVTSTSLLATPTLMIQDDGASQTEGDTEDQVEAGDQAEVGGQAEAGGQAQADSDPAESGGLPATDEVDLQETSDFQPPETGDVRGVSAEVKRTLTFDQEVSGKSVRALLVQASEKIERGVDEDRIELFSRDVEADESADATLSKQWEVTFNNISPEDVDLIVDQWSEDFNNRPYFPTSSTVGSQIAGDMQKQAFLAIFLSLLAIIGYVWFRFQNLAFGLAAVIALIHDVAIVLGAIAISHFIYGGLGFLLFTNFKISLEVVAALLTVIGYSLNDTIVVFDRIREVRGKRKDITAEIINTSISQTLSRTLLTSLTTLIVVGILYFRGGDAIHGFAYALVVGVLVGTYSSIFIASPALLWLMNTVGLNPMEVDPETK